MTYFSDSCTIYKCFSYFANILAYSSYLSICDFLFTFGVIWEYTLNFYTFKFVEVCFWPRICSVLVNTLCIYCFHYCSVAKSRLTLCNPMDCSMSCFPVLCYLPELAQTHVHWINDAIQPPHPVAPFLLCSIFPRIRIFSNELVLYNRWTKYWNTYFMYTCR